MQEKEEKQKPAGWTVLGSGTFADAVRAEIAKDPDRYRPVTWGAQPVGFCPCCGKNVHPVISRHTAWERGFSTSPGDEGVVHPSCVIPGKADCCCGERHGLEAVAP